MLADGLRVRNRFLYIILSIGVITGLVLAFYSLNRPRPQIVDGRGPGDTLVMFDWHVADAAPGDTGSDAPLAPASADGTAIEIQEGGPMRRRDWFWKQRAYPLDTLPVDANRNGVLQLQQMSNAQSAAEVWTALGPAPINAGLIGWVWDSTAERWRSLRTDVSGRTKAFAFHPTNPQIVYVGTATGGVWKTTNGGSSYFPLTDSQEPFSIFSLAIDNTNPNIIYAGTGELAGYYGGGVLKSTDAGASWTLLGTTEFAGLVVTSIMISPHNPSTIFVSTALPRTYGEQAEIPGVYRSTNGGQTWQSMLKCQQQCWGFTDLVIENNSNPLVLYAALSSAGIWRSADNGSTWSKLTNFPDRGYRRIELGIGQGTGSGILYAGLEAFDQNGRPFGAVFKSTDRGANWTHLQQAPNYCSGQCNYDNIIAVDPRNANVVYLGGSFISSNTGWGGVVHKSTDGGQTWRDMTPGDVPERMVHPDMHAIAFDPTNPDIVWIGNDGGVFRSLNGGQTWENRNGNLETLQFVNIGVHPTNPDVVFGGLQDNAKARFNGTFWEGLDGGDGGYSEIDPFIPSIWYGTNWSATDIGIRFHRNDFGGTPEGWVIKDTGLNVSDRMEFYVPFELDRSTPGVLYLGTHRLYRTTNRAETWAPISGDLTKGGDGSISTIAVAPSDPKTIYVGASDGSLQSTSNTGANWTNRTRAPLPNRYVSDIAVHPTDPAIVYAVFNGYNTHTPAAPGHVFMSTNGGQSWQDVSGNLPDLPVLTIVIDPEQPDHIYIGTDLGVFRSITGGRTWVAYSNGMPFVPVYDLELNQPNRMLWAGTYGRGVFRLALDETPPAASFRVSLPFVLQNYIAPTLAPTRTPTITPTSPATGPLPGLWEGESAKFTVSNDQSKAWDVLVKVPVPGCETWVSYLDMASITAGRFSFEVDLRENGTWRGNGTFNNSISAQGTAEFDQVYFGLSCGSWSGTVNWTATWVRAAPDPTPAPTATPPRPTATPSTTSGIHGQVRYQGAGISNIHLILRQCPTTGPCDFEASQLMSTVTDANGYYSFTGVPSLPANQFYFVFYFNHSDGGNLADSRYLWRWHAPPIRTYSAGTSAPGGNFDIGDLRLVGPTSGSVTLPATFTWNSRNLPGENYAWELFDLNTGQSLCSSNPAVGTSFSLTASDFTSVCGGSYGQEYGWFAWAVEGTNWEQGFGDSYSYGRVSFAASGAPTPTPSPTPTATPTTAPSAGINGVVTDRGAPASGVTVILRLCVSNSCSNLRTTVTSASGGYTFTNVPSLATGQSYQVAYINGAGGGNPLDATRLTWWVSFPITTYTTGSSAPGGNFDIGDVALTTPAHNASVLLPATFTWATRGLSSDRFSWSLSSTAGILLCYVDPPANALSFVLDLTTGSQCGLFYNTSYNWYVYVANGSWTNGYGLSHYYRTVSFTQSSALKENRFLNLAPSPVTTEPGPWLQDLPMPAPLP